ncbi:MAG: diacylglycerol kinase family protein [Anaerolineales bacterium]|jgi:diacylglycerol kinase
MPSEKSSNLIDSFRNAFAGLGHTLRTQRNARIHLTITTIVVCSGLWLGLTPVEWCLVFLAIGMVWMAELSNTVLESVVDLLKPEFDPLAKTAKDVKAGVVVVASLTAVLIGLLVMGPRLLLRIQDLFF